MALSSEFYWDIVFIKVCSYFSVVICTFKSNYVQVEDKLFSVPRCEFVNSSEVFADMFALPSGPMAPKEGQDKEHPIVLEGYKKDEFTSLLKVMYPTYVIIISIMILVILTYELLVELDL